MSEFCGWKFGLQLTIKKLSQKIKENCLTSKNQFNIIIKHAYLGVHVSASLKNSSHHKPSGGERNANIQPVSKKG